MSGDVVGLTALAEPFAGRVRVELDNSSGKYGAIGTGSLAAIRQGSQLKVSLGYYTSVGAEAVSPLVYWVEGWEYRRGEGDSRFVLLGEDGWGWLRAFQARRQFGWVAGEKSVLELLRFLLSRSGLKLMASSPSSFLSSHKPAFTLHPGTSGAQGVRMLLERVADRLFFHEQEAWLKNPDPSEASAYGYGTDHPLRSSHYAQAPAEVNRVQVYGSGAVAEAFSWDEVGRVLDRLLQVHDLNLSTLSDVQQRGQDRLAAALRAAASHEIAVAANPAQELYDVVEVTDASSGLSAARRRVAGMELRLAPASASYELRLRLSNV